jgi:sugar lactone lactonase YvrE
VTKPAARPVLAVVVVAVLATMLLLSVAARADAYVYWTNDNGTIGRANLDGTSPNQAFVTGPDEPFGIAVDKKHIYWADYAANAIGRANLDGTKVDESFITGASNPRGIAVDANYIYWTNSIAPGPDTIGRAKLDGSGVNQSFIATADTVFGVASSANHLYWANYSIDAIGRANLDGSGVTQTLVAPTGGTPQGIAVGADHVYWADYGSTGSALSRANLDGSAPNTSFITGLDNPYGVAVNSAHVYWTDRALDRAIGRATLDGGAVTANLIPGASSPYGVAVDALPLPPDTAPPETTITKAPANRVKKRRVRYKFSSSEPRSTFDCRLKGKGAKKSVRKFRWCRSPTKYKRLKKGTYRFEVRATDAAGNVDPTAARDRFRVVG